MIVGDFNFPEIDWSNWTVNASENHVSFHFVECLRDNFLSQHVQSNTRYRFGQNPSCLDLVITDDKNILENLKFGDKLGASDHVSITFDVQCIVDKTQNDKPRPRAFPLHFGKMPWNFADFES